MPAPFGPMIAWISPAFTSSERPLRICLPSILAWRFSIFSIVSLSVNVATGRASITVCGAAVALPNVARSAPADMSRRSKVVVRSARGLRHAAFSRVCASRLLRATACARLSAMRMAHSGGDARQHVVHVLEDVGGFRCITFTPTASSDLVAAAGESLVLAFLVDHDGHAEVVAIEIDDRAADHGESLERVAPKIGLGEPLRQRLVRLAGCRRISRACSCSASSRFSRDFPAAAFFLIAGASAVSDGSRSWSFLRSVIGLSLRTKIDGW